VSAPREILDLVARFEQQLDAYKSGQYNETQLLREFLDPFFKALGWDIDNEQGYAEAYKDVVHEDAIRMGSATKAPDYCFRIGGARKFFLEAKKPSVDIKQDISPAHQLRSYAWSAKLPLSILSDFEELAVYDCRIKPHKDDKASIGRIFYCTFRDYAEKWDWITSIFSRDAVLRGSFDKFAESSRGRRGTTEVDAAFLAEIEGWRKELAQNLALRNPKLTQRELNFAVQRIIDRVIFLRICEDRGIEDYGRLRALVNGDRIYPRLTRLFEDADTRYNSGLFHFKKEPGRHEDPDELTLSLDLDDKLLREILHGLYYPECPYQFSVLSADILGQVYEQFLGKIIRLTAGHRAEVDDKPEVKKAGGVYYTPTYIVDYIVRQTVGKLVEGKTPKQVEKISILDPACGSGSFLIGAYQFLLDWHLQFYLANSPVKWAKGGKPVLVQAGKSWKLTIAERKRILLANIYGVDIDTQAVEVTKLSLLLKVLEGETGQTLQTIFRLFQERALPDLGDNIKCGNSLIGPDFYQQGELPLLTNDEKYRINVFDWHAEFPRIFRRRRGLSRHSEAKVDDESQISSGELRETAVGELDYTMPGVPLHGKYSTRRIKDKIVPPAPVEPEWEGGFDAVIGNPPWGASFLAPELAYLRVSYSQVVARMIDSYIYFIDRATRVAKAEAPIGFIIPSTILNQVDARPVRELLLKRGLAVLLNLGQGIFGAKVLNTSTVFVSSGKSREAFVLENSTHLPLSERSAAMGRTKPASWKAWKKQVENDPHRTFFTGQLDGTALLQRLSQRHPPLSRFISGDIQRGVSPDVVAAHVIPKSEARRLKLETELLRSSLSGPQIKRYRDWKSDQFIVYTSRDVAIKNFPRALKFLEQFKSKNTCKEVEEGKHPWWALHRPRDPQIFSSPKFIGLTTSKTIELVYDPSDSVYVTDAMYVFSIVPGVEPFAFMAILQSKLFLFLYRVSNQGESRVIPQVKASKLDPLPLPQCDKPQPLLDKLGEQCRQMFKLQRQLAGARTPQEKTALERQIAATDMQIDALVYELYGLTGDEIKIVEGSK